MWRWPATTPTAITMSSQPVLIGTSTTSSPLNCSSSKPQYQTIIPMLIPPTQRKILQKPTQPPHPHPAAAHGAVLRAPRTSPSPLLSSLETAPTPSDLTSSRSRPGQTSSTASPPTPEGGAEESASSAATELSPMSRCVSRPRQPVASSLFMAALRYSRSPALCFRPQPRPAPEDSLYSCQAAKGRSWEGQWWGRWWLRVQWF